ncbi:MAG TPA: hypothetical protein HPP87_13145 [Planctomycetes bacterium]|nr:hypothetical protein [Planctomycetota bacterium]
MRPAEKIEKLIKKFEVDINPEKDRENLDELLRAQAQSIHPKPAFSHFNWRNIMKSPITKFATAAVIITAVFIGIDQFGQTVNLSAIAFAEISEATKNVSWMHQINKGFERGVKGKGEQWYGFETEIFASKPSQDKPLFIDLKENKRYRYDPKHQTITITNVDDFPLDLSSPLRMLESLSERFKEQGAEIIVKKSSYKGQQVQLQQISLSRTGPNNDENHLLRLYIQPKTKLLVGAEVKGTNADGKVIMDGEITFTYPQTGPSSIYDLGVPRDAKIVNNLPKAE